MKGVAVTSYQVIYRRFFWAFWFCVPNKCLSNQKIVIYEYMRLVKLYLVVLVVNKISILKGGDNK